MQSNTVKVSLKTWQTCGRWTVGIEGMDEEQLELGSSDGFWRFIAERRKQKTISRAKLEQMISKRT